ncbi:MAG: nickel pincer cofactor biosynthesis protein LarC [Oscillospiraceae bacterium]|nr:nickel pincer cofactor biosynthesis protein LarC [Oscillospiraceae bacterium]
MRTLYFECNMGAAGDMLMAALLELHDNPEDFLERLNNTGIPGVVVTSEPSVKHGVRGTHIKVKINNHEEHEHEHEHKHHEHTHSSGHNHSSYHETEHRIGHLKVSDSVKKNALAVYKLIAEAESRAHGVPVNQIHFHEVGELDAIADIVGVCMLTEELSPDLILASPVNTGSGFVRCAHGILPVPAPATAYIMQDAKIYSDNIKGELCTPTGAALLKHFAEDFCEMPVMSAAKIGYGMGAKDFERANCIRAYIGDTRSDTDNDDVIELACNLDDMTPEAVAFAQQLLLDEGALDVYITPIVMKKNRAGVMFTCMCRKKTKDKMLSLIFRHTSTLGIREYLCRRYILQKEHTEIETKYGKVRVKTSRGYGVKKAKPEYEDIAGIAKDNNISISEALNEIDF